ncbi:DUF3387 domain-containing protein [Thiocapsa marina]|uniref:Type I restriction enzyme HindI endonuclease subunit-like C-terminal domain-containing protein n=1 Tax=Thiocapsa marina 5811 TaxID=768671 RepID=F9U6W1_9GAMM|nr:DUF3387 domain-containing protein [Thiocapsa marina]EGV19987.1 hypothetical protein ThimaDRAFT_0663 [Thiocapsa marina 5811]
MGATWADDGKGPDSRARQRDIDAAVRQVIGGAVDADEVIDLFAVAGLDEARLDILSDEFLERVAALEQKNLALETLRKLLNDRIRSTERSNLVRSLKFREALEDALLRYTNKAITTAEMIARLIDLARDLREAQRQDEALGLSTEEIAFYDALAENASAREVMQSGALRLMARELTEMLRPHEWYARVADSVVGSDGGRPPQIGVKWSDRGDEAWQNPRKYEAITRTISNTFVAAAATGVEDTDDEYSAILAKPAGPSAQRPLAGLRPGTIRTDCLCVERGSGLRRHAGDDQTRRHRELRLQPMPGVLPDAAGLGHLRGDRQRDQDRRLSRRRDRLARQFLVKQRHQGGRGQCSDGLRVRSIPALSPQP